MAHGVAGRLRPRIFLRFRHYKGGRSSAKRTGRRYHRINSWHSFSEAESTSRHMVMSGVPRKRSPVTPPGIDPGTVRLVAQRLNHYATTGPHITYYSVCTYLQINITQKVMIRKKRTLLNTHNISRDKERMRVSSYIPSPHTHTHSGWPP